MDMVGDAAVEEGAEARDADRYAVYFTEEELLALAEFFGAYGEMEDHLHDRIGRKAMINCAKYGFYDGEL